jgi:hypothetical protein
MCRRFASARSSPAGIDTVIHGLAQFLDALAGFNEGHRRMVADNDPHPFSAPAIAQQPRPARAAALLADAQLQPGGSRISVVPRWQSHKPRGHHPAFCDHPGNTDLMHGRLERYQQYQTLLIT